jgi:SET domain-containing protein
MQKHTLISKALVVAPSPIHGWGVFSPQAITAGDIIEQCPVLLSRYQLPAYKDYYFKWDANQVALPLGRAALLNHHDSPNVRYHIDTKNNLLELVAVRAIAAGEELVVSYGRDNWFLSRGTRKRRPSFFAKLKNWIWINKNRSH